MEEKHYEILSRVEWPSDIKNLSMDELKTLCAEIRGYMIDCCSINPGHLGSSLGAVELIVGFHYVYDSPEDRIVFDVGHQAYAHKILTGRKELFRMNRKKGGISGFPKMDESVYDAFGTGHSSTSISAAIGIAKAAEMSGSGMKTVALIGDGALSGGLAFEGLNNATESNADLLIIVNDNNISIDKNIGAIHRHLLKLTTSAQYNRLKKNIWDGLGESRFRDMMQRMVVHTKSALVMSSGGALFESLGFRYFGPIDGNDIVSVVNTLRKLKGIKGPRVLHAITTKGKGFAPAEEDQTLWHAPGMFDPVSGKRITGGTDGLSRYQDVFGEVLLELAKKDERVVGVTPAMASGCGMNILAKEMPERFFDVGIAEEHAVTFSAGLAAGGLKPFCNIYSSFAQRAYDQIIHDVALQGLGVVLCFDRGGIVGEDGATHHGVFDMAAFRSIPGVTIAAPKDETELKNLMYTAWKGAEGPFIIRYPRGYGEGTAWREAEFRELPAGKGELLADGTDVAVLAAGPFAYRALEAARICKEKTGIMPAVYNIRYIKPVDTEILDRALREFSSVVTVEDGCIAGGLFGEVAEYASARGLGTSVRPVGIPDEFIAQGTQKELRHDCGLDTDGILAAILQELGKRE